MTKTRVQIKLCRLVDRDGVFNPLMGVRISPKATIRASVACRKVLRFFVHLFEFYGIKLAWVNRMGSKTFRRLRSMHKFELTRFKEEIFRKT